MTGPDEIRRLIEQVEKLRASDDAPSNGGQAYDYAYNHAIADVLELLEAHPAASSHAERDEKDTKGG